MQTKWGSAYLQFGYYIVDTVVGGVRFRKQLHRLIYEDYHKITLMPWAVVHHVDGNKLNNDPLNLQAMTRTEHQKLHHTGAKRSEETRKRMSESSKIRTSTKDGRIHMAKIALKKLTQEEIIMIRLMLEKYNYRGIIRDIANLYNVEAHTISKIKNRPTYGGV
jgi:hypothetical protein